MGAFLFQIELPVLTEEIINIIPAHRDQVNKLFSEGRMLSYSVSQHRNMIWAVLNAEDEPEAMEIIVKLPLFKYFTDTVCHPLLFHNTLPAAVPGISLN
jgi:muconolactone delta-isomerase